MSSTSINAETDRDSLPNGGNARLAVVVATALATFFQQALLSYVLPLYFEVRGLPSSAWETWGLYQILAWLFAPLLSWLVSRRLGLPRVWAVGLAASGFIFAWLAILPGGETATGAVVGGAGLLYGTASALVWTSGITLAQRVPEVERGRANALMMIALGLGSIAGPLLGRLGSAWPGASAAGAPVGFLVLLAGGALACFAGAVLVDRYGEHRQSASGSALPVAAPSLRDDLRLIRSAGFLLTVVPVSLLAGPIFQAVNVYLAYRASEAQIGLIVDGRDHGWAALQVITYVMQLAGGLLVGRVAGRGISAGVAAALLGAFVLCGIGIGLAPGAITLFACVAGFEVGRQFSRWLQTGYVSEQVPGEQQAAAISVSVMLSGIGGSAFMVLSRRLQSPDAPSFSPTLPFLVAGAIGLAGALLLLVRHTGRRPVASGESSKQSQPYTQQTHGHRSGEETPVRNPCRARQKPVEEGREDGRTEIFRK